MHNIRAPAIGTESMVPVMLPIMYFLGREKNISVFETKVSHTLKQRHLATFEATPRKFESLYLLRMFLRRGTYSDQLSK